MYLPVIDTLAMTTTADIVAARRARLRAWIDQHYAGVQRNFVDATKINQGELSALLTSKSFGEKKARALEIQARMPDGYLVSPLVEPSALPAPPAPGPALSPDALRLAQVYDHASPAQRAAFDALARGYEDAGAGKTKP